MSIKQISMKYIILFLKKLFTSVYGFHFYLEFVIISYNLDKYYCSPIGGFTLLDSNALDMANMYESYV